MSSGKLFGLVSGLVLVALFIISCGGAPAAAPTVQAPTASPTLVPPTPGSTPDVLSGFVENDGVQIHYEVEGQGPPLILAHWLMGSLEDWRLFGYVDALKANYRLILIDARGHGQSDKPHDPGAYALEKQVGDIVAVLDKLGVDKANYFGYSNGGTLGWALAKYAPDRLASLIIGGDAPEGHDDSDEIAFIRENGIEQYAQFYEDAARAKGAWKPEMNPLYAANDVEAIVADLASFSAESFAADLPNMKMPILLLAGTGDGEYPGIEAAAKKLPNATFAALPDLDHGGVYFSPDQVLAHLTKFLAQ